MTNHQPEPGAVMRWLVPLSAEPGGEPVCVDVYVLETRDGFGRTDALVQPVAGSGRRWVYASSLVHPTYPAVVAALPESE